MKNILFIGGSLNQTRMAHAVARYLQNEYTCYFTPFYCDGFNRTIAEAGWLDFTVMGGKPRRQTEAYLKDHNLSVDYRGESHNYDLVVTTSDLIIQRNIKNKPIILIQEGMTDPETIMYHLVKWLKLPRWLVSTAATGLSNIYRYFCVASEGYKDLFVSKEADPDKIMVTGIPNFDNVAQFLENDFPEQDYVLVATSNARETFKFDDRKKFICYALDIANGRPVIFKLHPNENFDRAIAEIKALAPQAKVYTEGNIEPMIANCEVLITQYSTVSYIGLALGKEVHSYFDIEVLKKLTPMQNAGTSGRAIVEVCRRLL